MSQELSQLNRERRSRDGPSLIRGWRGTPLLGFSLVVALLLSGCSDTSSPGSRSGSDFEEATASDIAVVEERHEDLLVDGGILYDRNCSVCHGPYGDGGVGPPLAGNRNLASSTYVVARIQLGGGGMPPFIRLLSTDEIAAVASFIRTGWQNSLEPIQADQVELQWNGYRKGQRYGTRAPNEF